MKKYNFIIITLVLSAFLACEHDEDKRPSGGAWNTGPLTGYSVTPINGGATITYDIPRDNDILYVMAEYERNGKIFTEKASVHKNELTIEGFNTTSPVKASLYKVNKQEQRSEPLEIEFEPLEGLITIAQNSLEMIPGFGGIVASWHNPGNTEFGVRLVVPDEQRPGELLTHEMYFSSTENDRRSFRGFEPEEKAFGVAFEDKWGNISDTTWLTTTPFFETMVPKPYADFRASIPYDNPTTLGGRDINTLWDNVVNTASHGWLTQPGAGNGLSMTIDLGQVVKLSRIVIHGYHINSVYGQANVTQFELWGSDKIDFARLSDRPYWLDETSVRNNAFSNDVANKLDPMAEIPAHTFKDDWQYLNWHAIPRFDRMVPPDPQGAANLATNGTEYEMPLDAKPVRYLRLFVREIAGVMPPAPNNYWSMGEFTAYGDNTVPQN
ncbi:hypothetical protein GCM10007415_19020 [Parapedobacter pyrenivorans]|uniref:F5/8 type C domain-containing protein n=1 Tax=Parapedobacter pyrenivorans TaxID=1305674 RepID=A0A917HQ97_9SPHI|nr:DUF4959 domain-containing protein [Parapedobacter pyrenivorans]GGG85815.1 hypothetical protein GCM10007415_19020 [Parapedobacter pyrenivorans]